MHQHPGVLEAAAVLPFVLALVFYLHAAWRERTTGRGWPLHRMLLWTGGVGCAAAGFIGPLAQSAHTNFVAHMAAHLLLGMAAPLLLVMAAPVTLALRSMEQVPAIRLSRLLKSRPVRFLSHPAPAAVLNAGSLWLLYATATGAGLLANELLHPLIQVHFLLAGYLFTASIIGKDPTPHRPSFRTRAVCLAAALAGHSVLAKFVYAYPPAGVPVDQAQAGGVLMFYGGDAVDLVLLIAFCAQWYRYTTPATAGNRSKAAPSRRA
ncbi:hypothetical protein D477_018404 [Arthrobacter crystallopoietes BAB-32]|uniref:Cytochrome c oxidase assembly protein n=1 Tax=Arthrobacter crystallopoietes BAB-32 TaxID=1246476 RepID=N1UY76_9MICC|nr:cytochrome c oxidase assembly protein [Arthrobacter crystallopoietes]EMY32782.1 hypothetical protein D477_018404 [Arthrobacter crystallopoietes BAB-32]